MKVGFDISQIAHPGGVATYTKNLTEQLLKNKSLDLEFLYFSLRKKYQGNLPNVKSFPIPPTILEILFNKLRSIPIETFIGEIDIYHSSDWTQPRTHAKRVTTYHDVIPLKYPEWSHPKIVEVHKRRLEIVEKEIDMIIAVSESTKKDLLKVTKIPEEKITVIYEAATFDKVSDNDQMLKEFKEKYHLPDKFILAIGGIGTRRNIDRIKQSTKGYNLIITGETIPWVDDQELVYLYKSASLLLYPSFYEGFGIPVLDAFKCGVPVITSDVSSLPEVGGDAAIYVDPNNVKDIGEKVQRVMEDTQLQKEMINKGLHQETKFSWIKSADKTANIYQKIIGKSET